MNDSTRISIAVVDDHPILRHGLAAVLRNEPRFRLVAEGGTATEALQIAQLHRPDIMILDLDIPGRGIEALKQIVVEFPLVRCIILTVCDSADAAIVALNAGAQGYILKGVSAGDLKSAIWTVLNNESFVSPEFATKLLLAAQNKNQDTAVADSRLSFRESQILREVEAGLSNRMIGEKLRISEKTVKHYMSSIMQKYGVNNRVSAVIAYQKVRQSRPHA
jgi:two-component system, NarL family, nitrate/nitrite response regulator NarL